MVGVKVGSTAVPVMVWVDHFLSEIRMPRCADTQYGRPQVCPYKRPTIEYRIVGSFEEENFHKFHGCMAIRESFLPEIWERGILWHSKSEQSPKFSSQKSHFSVIRESFLSRKFPAIRYTCM